MLVYYREVIVKTHDYHKHTDTMENLSSRISALIEDQELSNERLGALVGWSASKLSQIRRGEYSASDDKLIRQLKNAERDNKALSELVSFLSGDTGVQLDLVWLTQYKPHEIEQKLYQRTHNTTTTKHPQHPMESPDKLNAYQDELSTLSGLDGAFIAQKMADGLNDVELVIQFNAYVRPVEKNEPVLPRFRGMGEPEKSP